MKNIKLIMISICALGIGLIYFAINYEWIIFRHSIITDYYHAKKSPNTKRECTLFYWQNKQGWNQEKTVLVWSENEGHNCKQLISALLSLWEEEHLATKKITLDSALLSASGQELFLSFSRNMFDKEEPLYIKWMRIESILKTIAQHFPQIQLVRFLVQHQPLRDSQLDFSQSWPIHGFLEK